MPSPTKPGGNGPTKPLVKTNTTPAATPVAGKPNYTG
jgi:hypothetical protein